MPESISARLQRYKEAASWLPKGEYIAAHGGHGENGRYVVDEYFVIRPDDDVAIAADIVDPDTSQPAPLIAEFFALSCKALPDAVSIAEEAIQTLTKVLQELNRAVSEGGMHPDDAQALWYFVEAFLAK